MFWAALHILVLLLHVNGVWCCSGHERDSLLHFNASVHDLFNQVFKSWHGFNCCEWNGIQCHPRTHHVIRLDLHGGPPDAYLYNVMGDVLSPLFNLQHLEHLDLSWNNFYRVRIPPGLDRLKRLRYLDLSETGLSGDIPRELGNMSNLQHLDLSLNGLSGDIPRELGNMSNLQHLDLSVNRLSGDIPREVGNISTLNYLDLSGNFDRDDSSPLLRMVDMRTWTGNMKDLKDLYLGEVNMSRVERNDLGIVLSTMYSLTSLGMSRCYLPGKIPPYLAKLTNLTDLDLSSNEFYGPIPSMLFTAFPNLQNVDLSYNQLTGKIPASVGQLTSLEVLDLNNNKLEGAIPAFVGQLTSLEELDLSYNMLEGAIPASVGQLTSLEVLDLNNNKLEGAIPAFVGQLTSLEALDLSNNNLEGAIPLNISSLSKLKMLYLRSSRLSGEFSESHLDNLSKLVKVDISDNLLTCKFSPTWIPKLSLEWLALSSCNMEGKFPTFLITQYWIVEVDLFNCSLAGNIPEWIWDLNSLAYLNLSHNYFAGVLPPAVLSSFLSVLDVSENQLSGSIAAKIGESINLEYLSLSGNHLSGSVPPSICQIQIVDLSNNNLTGNIPACFKNGSSIEMLNLENNLLEGKLPQQLGDMFYLRTLKLGRNRLNSFLPSSLANCKQLEILDLNNNKMRGIIPNWIGKLSNLKILILRSNRFGGGIPSEVTTLPLLQILDLSSNKFSGIIPATISSLQAMRNETVTSEIFNVPVNRSRQIYVDRVTIINKAQEMEFARSLALVKCIDLSNNNLGGGIPSNMGLLGGLVILNVSRNDIAGEIPKSLGEMVNLESLDLSHNQLSGNIPLELQSLTFLAYLDVSQNNLSGKIPQGGQFYTFESSSFSNNSDLCGLQLNTTCCGNQSCPSPKRNVDKMDEEEEDDIWWGVGLGLSFAVGFSIVIGVLCLTTTWSRKCFQTMDNIIFYLFERFRK